MDRVVRLSAFTDPDGAAEVDWRRGAACHGEDPELFFPVGTGPAAVQAIEQAQAVCAGCPVRVKCLSWAVESGQSDGVWGGKTPGERRALRRRARRQRTGA